MNIFDIFHAFIRRLTFRTIFPLFFFLWIFILILVNFEKRALINIVKIFKNKILIILFSDDIDKIRLKLFKLDELIKEINTFGNDNKFRLLWFGSKDYVGYIEHYSNAVIVLFIKVEKVKSKQMVEDRSEYLRL